MKWIEFAVYTSDNGIDPVCGALAGIGIDQVSIEESESRIAATLREAAPYWDFADAAALANKRGPCVKAYIADLPEQQPLLQAARESMHRLREIFPEEQLSPLDIVEIRMDEEDWANNWKQYYKPMQIGKRLLVCPSWEVDTLTRAQSEGRLLVCLDPGMVFGTGAHHTTRLCLEALEGIVRPGDHVLDLGCGSGILSIAACKLGAAHVNCVDIDPVAKRVVRENLGMNGLCDADCTIWIGNALTDEHLRQRIAAHNVQAGYDIVVANIIADVVIGLCTFVPQILKQGGLFLCSGVIDERGEDVIAALERAGLRLLSRFRSADDEEGAPETGWLAFLAEKAL